MDFLSGEQELILNRLAFRKGKFTYWNEWVDPNIEKANWNIICHICNEKFYIHDYVYHGRLHLKESNLLVFL